MIVKGVIRLNILTVLSCWLLSIAIAGDKMTLYPNQYNKDTYIAIARQGNIELKIVAYRSSNSNNIFLVTMTTKNGNQSVTINFKP